MTPNRYAVTRFCSRLSFVTVLSSMEAVMAIAEIRKIIQSCNFYQEQVRRITERSACLSNMEVIRDKALDFYRAAWEEGGMKTEPTPYGFRARRRPHDWWEWAKVPNIPKATKEQ